jgi:hypothetical protein
MRKREILESQHRSVISEALVVMLGSKELADAWWYSHNKAFDMKRPIDTDLEIVRDYVIWHVSGQY